jgi:hypothetical protein
MGAAAKPETTAVAKRVDARVAELKERNALVAAIRGTQWGRDTTPEMARAVAHYCHENGLDPVRHVEILGGRIYLTAEFYDERGAELIRSGVVQPDEPDYVHADERLDKLAAEGDEWAKTEQQRRLRLRIVHGIPEGAKGACIQRFRLAETGKAILGVNWCGGVRPKTQYGKDADPIGEAEPTKTATTRARRRAWKQIADVIPGYGEMVKPVEATARMVSETLPVSVVEAPRGPRALVGSGEDPYVETPIPPAQHSSDPAARAEDYQDDSDLVEAELPLDDERPRRGRNAQLD